MFLFSATIRSIEKYTGTFTETTETQNVALCSFDRYAI